MPRLSPPPIPSYPEFADEAEEDAYREESDATAHALAFRLLDVCSRQWWGGGSWGNGLANAIGYIEEAAASLALTPPREGTPGSGRSDLRPGVARRVWDRDGWECRCCHSHVDLTVDHIKPVIKCGTNDFGNLQTLCRRCNSSKNDREMTIEQLRAALGVLAA